MADRLRFAYPNPFPRNHCVVHAWTHLAGGDEETARVLKYSAVADRQLTEDGTKRGLDFSWWARQLGLKVVEEKHLLRVRGAVTGWVSSRYAPVPALPTLQRFAREHPRGRYMVRVSGHAVAVIDGVVWGYHRPRTRVLQYLKVEG
jgi:hypothetical protein